MLSYHRADNQYVNSFQGEELRYKLQNISEQVKLTKTVYIMTIEESNYVTNIHKYTVTNFGRYAVLERK